MLLVVVDVNVERSKTEEKQLMTTGLFHLKYNILPKL